MTRAGLVCTAWCVALVVALVPTAADAQESPDSSGRDEAQELADRYSPIVMLKAQEEACDSDGEPYGPASIEIVLDNPAVALRQLSPNDPVVVRGPNASDLFGLGEGFYLDFPGSALDPGCLYERDFERFTADHPPTVYAHIAQHDDHPGQLALQYWIYWYYNDWNNKHESDWEMIQLLFEASSIDEALAEEPVSVGYAQHEGGERARWDATKLEREDTHPVVYSSAGSHASYFGSALYLGRSGGEGFGCDNTDGPSDRVEPAVVVLPDTVDDPADPLAWLSYEGRWGERQGGPFNGPTGPSAKERWLEAVDWHDELRATSVVIPGGDSTGSGIILVFCDLVEWGSGTIISFTTSPARLLISAGLFVLLLRWLSRRTDWTRVPSSPLVRRRRAGQIIRASGALYRYSTVALLTFGLVYLPTALVVGLLGALLTWLPVVGDLLGVAGRSSGTSLGLAIIAGGVPTFAAYTAIHAMAAVYLQGATEGRPGSARAAVRSVWERRRDLGVGFIRGFVIVYLLLITVVGAPWALRQLVRYQFLSQAVMLEGLDGKGGLARSSELVSGRWWHTAIMVTLFNGLVALSGLAFGLVMLVVFAGLPMWMFSALVTLIYALVVPVTSAAQAMLYGDAVAERQGAEKADLVDA